MKINEIMSREVRTIAPETTLREAAQLMRQADIGALIINESDRMIGMIGMIGMITDRDLVIRAMAEGTNMDTPVRAVMTEEVLYCYEDEEVDHIAKNMAQNQKRRLPVVNREKRLVGIVSLANLASCSKDKVSATVLRGVANMH